MHHTSSGNKPKLLDQVRTVIRRKFYSLRTEEAYVNWIKRYILFHNKRHPAEMAETEVELFLNHLAVEKKVSASTQNQALCALVFLYRHVLGKEMGWMDNLQRARKPERLPVVLTRTEVEHLLAHLEGRSWLMAALLYGAGLRLMESENGSATHQISVRGYLLLARNRFGPYHSQKPVTVKGNKETPHHRGVGEFFRYARAAPMPDIGHHGLQSMSLKNGTLVRQRDLFRLL